MLTNDIKKKFLRLSCELSPENLHCDGEISNAQAMRKYKKLKLEWAKLERQVGRVVTESEVWSFSNYNY